MSKEDEIWKPSTDKIRKFESEVLKKVLPHTRFAESGMFGSPDVAPNSFHGKLSSENLFKDTQYEYKGDGNFIHYTSLIGIKAILDSGWLRMSEFGNLIDRNELMYAASVFEDNELFRPQVQTLNNLKNTVFCLSACESSQETWVDPFMWQMYGDKGNGVFIEYTFTNKNPYCYIFGNVQYGQDALEPLKSLKKLSEEFRTQNEDFFPEKFVELLIEMESFHKSKRFAIEKEVRLIFREDKNQYEDHTHSAIYKDINSNQEVKYFSKLYLKGRHPFVTKENIEKIGESKIFDVFPQVEIKKITLGFNISIENKVELMYFFNKLKEQHGYEFEIHHMNNEAEILKMI